MIINAPITLCIYRSEHKCMFVSSFDGESLLIFISEAMGHVTDISDILHQGWLRRNDPLPQHKRPKGNICNYNEKLISCTATILFSLHHEGKLPTQLCIRGNIKPHDTSRHFWWQEVNINYTRSFQNQGSEEIKPSNTMCITSTLQNRSIIWIIHKTLIKINTWNEKSKIIWSLFDSKILTFTPSSHPYEHVPSQPAHLLVRSGLYVPWLPGEAWASETLWR